MPSSFSTSVPTKSAKSLTPLLEGEGGLAKGQLPIEVKEGLVKLDRERYRKKVYNTIPYSTYHPTYMNGWLVSSSTGVPTKNAKSLTPLLEVG